MRDGVDPAERSPDGNRALENHVFSLVGAAQSDTFDLQNASRYDHRHDLAADPYAHALTLQDAGKALRRLRKRRGWTLDDMTAMTGVTKMAISHIERGTTTPRPSTVARIEAGLGWPSGAFYRLANAPEGDDDLDKLAESFSAESKAKSALPVSMVNGPEVFEHYTEAYIEMIDALIEQLPAPAHPRHDATVLAALSRCGRLGVLTATSWRVATATDKDAADRLLRMLGELEAKRRNLLSRIPESTAARFDAACRDSGLPDALISVLTGLNAEEAWSVRIGGPTPDGAGARLALFMRSVESGSLPRRG